MSRRRHDKRHGHQSVHARWHEYRESAEDVKTSEASRGLGIGKKVSFIPHRCKGCWLIGTFGEADVNILIPTGE
jgi:hypothetical protein